MAPFRFGIEQCSTIINRCGDLVDPLRKVNQMFIIDNPSDELRVASEEEWIERKAASLREVLMEIPFWSCGHIRADD